MRGNSECRVRFECRVKCSSTKNYNIQPGNLTMLKPRGSSSLFPFPGHPWSFVLVLVNSSIWLDWFWGHHLATVGGAGIDLCSLWCGNIVWTHEHLRLNKFSFRSAYRGIHSSGRQLKAAIADEISTTPRPFWIRSNKNKFWTLKVFGLWNCYRIYFVRNEECYFWILHFFL